MYRTLADLVVLAHAAFVLFVIVGGLLVLRWPRLVWLHVPAVVWGSLVELCGWGCPLTPLENWLRSLSGGDAYHGGFVEHYVLPVLYPVTLTRTTQLVLGGGVLVVNAVVYGWVLRRGRR